MSSDEASDGAMDFEYYGDDDQYYLDYPYGESYDLGDHVRNVEIEKHGANGLRVSWNVHKADDSDNEDCEVFIQLYCEGNPLGDKRTVSDSFACFENLEHFKKYSADVWTADEEPEDVEILSNDSRCSKWIILGEEEFFEVAKELLKYVYVLEKMISQEEDEAKLNNMKQMHEDISQLGKTIYQSTPLPSRETLYEYKETLQMWFNEKSLGLPDIRGLEISVDNEGASITASWKAIAWPNNLQYAVQVFSNQTERGDVKIVSRGSFVIEDPDPNKKYMVDIWSICGEETGIHTRSDEIMICRDLGNVLVNCLKPMREGYRVYEGYLKGACGKLDKVAIKIVNVSDDGKLRRELKINEDLRPSPFVVSSLGSGDIRGSVERQAYIVLELCKSDTLFEMVKKSELSGARRKKALSDIIEGLKYIHLKNILHRDLKPQNILCSLNGEDLKISDFGLSKQTRIAMSKVSKSAHEIGTEGWGSPEHYEGAEMSEKSDIYSAGLVFFFVLSDGKHAMGENEYQWKAKIIQGAEVDYSPLAADEDADIAQDLIQKMLVKNPSDRPSAGMVFDHPFLADEYERLEYLKRQAQFFARFTYAKNPASPNNATAATIEKLKNNTQLLETRSYEANWLKKLEEQDGVLEKFPNLMKKAATRKYDHGCIFHLLRFIRNTYVHFMEDDLREEFDNSEENVWRFFSRTFPGLICAVYNA